jgi:hypothetical protein
MILSIEQETLEHRTKYFEELRELLFLGRIII